MLQHKLFQVLSETREENSAAFEIGVNWQHPLFGGHFPGLPILPGACMVQIAVELFSCLQKRPFLLTETGKVKFIQTVTPETRDGISFSFSWEEVTEDICNVRVNVTKNERLLSKMHLILKSE